MISYHNRNELRTPERPEEEPHLPSAPPPCQPARAQPTQFVRMRPDLTWKRLSSEPTCSTSMAEPASVEITEPLAPGEAQKSGARPAGRHGLLKHSREFLDFFWDIASRSRRRGLRLQRSSAGISACTSRRYGGEVWAGAPEILASSGELGVHRSRTWTTQVSARRGAGMGGTVTLLTGPPGDVLGSVGSSRMSTP